jgi:antitoxin (DNA-binding transcriptional repressor) of toxin-antitoxin stability system
MARVSVEIGAVLIRAVRVSAGKAFAVKEDGQPVDRLVPYAHRSDDLLLERAHDISIRGVHRIAARLTDEIRA